MVSTKQFKMFENKQNDKNNFKKYNLKTFIIQSQVNLLNNMNLPETKLVIL